ncbi:MAG: cyclic nucleotide-binding domain-containing protein [Spirochaetota bacterium]|nr:cyclic nucleotide-binding domain-containing protein [Spirochaetota bacterium]
MSNGGTSTQTGIITRRYKHGSIIYFEGDKSEYIYILKAGKVILTSIKIDTGEEDKEEIKLGEFFGVKSALGKYPREETAQTIGETILLVLTLADFEKLILKKVELVMKMLRVFSNQLRRIGRMVREVLGETDTINPEVELFKIGDYYYKIGKYQQALHSFKRYMEYYPDTKYSSVAMNRIKAIETGNTDSELDIEEQSPNVAKKDQDIDLTDFSIDEDSNYGDSNNDIDFSLELEAESAIDNEMDNLFSDDDNDIDDFSFDESQPKKSKEKKEDITEIFYNGVSLFSQENYQEAVSLFTNILNIKELKNASEKKIFEKAHLEVGRCYLKLGKYKDALGSLSSMIKKFPESDNMKNVLLHIGLAYEMSNKLDIANSYYKKVALLEPKDSITKQALKRLKTIKDKQEKA